MSAENNPKTPWRNGYWFNKESPVLITFVENESASMKNLICFDNPNTADFMKGTWKFGDFGKADEKFVEMTGIENYNFMAEFNNAFFKFPGIVDEEGTTIYAKSFHPGVIDVLKWLSEEEKLKLQEDREPADAPTLPAYIKVQPQNQGKLLWFSGPPGAGKSTTAQLLARNHGYVYYEADCLSMFVNPYIDIHTPNPSLAQINQKPLKGLSKELMEAVDLRSKLMEEMDKGGFGDDFAQKFTKISTITAQEIKKQKEKIGGDWAIAFAVFSRKNRDELRAIFGSNLYFVVLNITKECNIKRIKGRHGDQGGEEMSKMFDELEARYEKAGEDEENAFNITITEDMTPDDVVNEVQAVLRKNSVI